MVIRDLIRCYISVSAIGVDTADDGQLNFPNGCPRVRQVADEPTASIGVFNNAGNVSFFLLVIEGILLLKASLSVTVGKLMYDRLISKSHAPNVSEPLEWIKSRIVNQAGLTLTFTFAWLSVLSSQNVVHWLLDRWQRWENASLILRLCTAGVCTLKVFVFLNIYDRVSDLLSSYGMNNWAAGFSNLITAHGVMIGFGWERVFHHALDDSAIRFGQFKAGLVPHLFREGSTLTDLNHILASHLSTVDECPLTCQRFRLLFIGLSVASVWLCFVPALIWHFNPQLEKAQKERMKGLPIDNKAAKALLRLDTMVSNANI